MATRTKKRPMSDTHKEALAEGRNHARVVGRYLEALEANKPKRGRKPGSDRQTARSRRIGASDRTHGCRSAFRPRRSRALLRAAPPQPLLDPPARAQSDRRAHRPAARAGRAV